MKPTKAQQKVLDLMYEFSGPLKIAPDFAWVPLPQGFTVGVALRVALEMVRRGLVEPIEGSPGVYRLPEASANTES